MCCGRESLTTHYFAKLIPVFDLLKRQVLDGSARNDKPVEVAVLHILKGLVKCKKMLLRCVFGYVGGGVEKFKLHLQGSVAEKP